MKKIIQTLHGRKQLYKKIDQLPISKSGTDDDGDHFVQLNDGTIFFGNSYVPARLDKPIFYNLLSRKTRNVLQFESMQVAIDIIIRYIEGALQYKGPVKQAYYKVDTGDCVAEMGAYQGFYSLKLAKQVGPAGKVVCIEPMPDNFRLLKKNKEFNNLDQMSIVNKGVWDSKKILNFNRRKGDGQSSSIEMLYDNADLFSVQADSLDNIFSEISIKPKDFIIIQLNGAEINALRGLLSFNPKHLSIAARYDTEGEDAAQAIRKLLESRGYEVRIDQEDFVYAQLKK